ncbi:MAG: hypothetical protein KGM43_08355 [Planctomycetota bacterium]|nr:hypothetical protein [Planctomycetota bacterium]
MPIKLRCGSCRQLMGVSRSKAGMLVKCPKCGVPVRVPEIEPIEGELAHRRAPSGDAATDSVERDVTAAPAKTREPRTGFLVGAPFETIDDLRPEDIRVEPGIEYTPPPIEQVGEIELGITFEPTPRGRVEASGSGITPSPTAGREFEAQHIEPMPPTPASSQTAAPTHVEPTPQADPVSEVERMRESIFTPRSADVETELPIDVEPPLERDRPIDRDRAIAPRPRDLILPRSVVMAWSLFVLLALAATFLAGLLAGHFIWRVH